MYKLIGVMGFMATITLLGGCGQSGALQLTNDPNLDTRPKYLLWHGQQEDKQNKTETTASEPSSTPNTRSSGQNN